MSVSHIITENQKSALLVSYYYFFSSWLSPLALFPRFDRDLPRRIDGTACGGRNGGSDGEAKPVEESDRGRDGNTDLPYRGIIKEVMEALDDIKVDVLAAKEHVEDRHSNEHGHETKGALESNRLERCDLVMAHDLFFHHKLGRSKELRAQHEHDTQERFGIERTAVLA